MDENTWYNITKVIYYILILIIIAAFVFLLNGVKKTLKKYEDVYKKKREKREKERQKREAERLKKLKEKEEDRLKKEAEERYKQEQIRKKEEEEKTAMEELKHVASKKIVAEKVDVDKEIEEEEETDKEEDHLQNYLIKGEKIKDKKHFKGRHLYLTDFRVILYKKNTVGALNYFEDIHYNHINSISCKRIVNKKGVRFSIILIVISLFLSFLLKLLQPVLQFIITNPTLEKPTIPGIIFVIGVILLIIFSIGTKHLTIVSYQAKIEVPIEKGLIKKIRQYQQNYLKKRSK